MIRARGGVALGLAILLAGCSAPTPSPAPPTPPPTSEPSTPPTTPTPSPIAVVTPSPSPTPVPTVCPLQPDSGRLPSDRLTDVRIDTADGADIITFVLGEPSSAAPPQGASEGSIGVAEPPFVGGASGLPLDVQGDRVLELRFTGMTLADDDGSPTYDGPDEFRPERTAVRSVVLREAFEGIVSWYIGYDGPGCVTLTSAVGSVSVVIPHGAG